MWTPHASSHQYHSIQSPVPQGSSNTSISTASFPSEQFNKPDPESLFNVGHPRCHLKHRIESLVLQLLKEITSCRKRPREPVVTLNRASRRAVLKTTTSQSAYSQDTLTQHSFSFSQSPTCTVSSSVGTSQDIWASPSSFDSFSSPCFEMPSPPPPQSEAPGPLFNFMNHSKHNRLFHPDGTLTLGSKKRHRDWRENRSLRTSSLMISMLNEVHQLLENRLMVTQRDLFYKLLPLGVEKQSQVNDMILDVCELLQCQRIDLGVASSPRGFIGGCLKWWKSTEELNSLDCEESALDVSAHSGGVPVPGHVWWRDYNFASNAKFVLIVEKEGIFHRLMEDEFWKRTPCIIVTGCGFPDLSTRILLHRLDSVLHLPCFCLVDYNPFGFQIYLTYLHGSARMAHRSQNCALPNLYWLGLRHKDTSGERMRHLCRQVFSYSDEKKIHDLLFADPHHAYPLKKEHRMELEFMAQNKYKVELQSLFNVIGIKEFSDYIRDLIREASAQNEES